MSRTPAVISAEVAWTTALVGVVTVGTSVVGGPDVVGGVFGHNAFDTLPRVLEVRATRGRSQALAGVEQGACTLVISDPAGDYNPQSPTALIAAVDTDLRPVRVRASHNGTTYGVFAGYLAEISHQPNLDARTTTLQAVDLIEWLAFLKPTIASTGPIRVGAAIGLLLDAAGWTDPAWRALDDGDLLPDFSADGTATATTLIGNLLAVDLGLVFVDGDGVVRYLARSRLYGDQTPVDTFGADVLLNLAPSRSSRNVVNRQTVTREGGVAQTAEYNPGRTPWREGGAITSPYLRDDSQAANLAAWIVQTRSRGDSPVRAVEIPNVADDLIVRQLSRELGDVVALGEPWGGTSARGTIVGLSHEFRDQTAHVTTYTVVVQPTTVLTVGSSTVGNSHVVGY